MDKNAKRCRIWIPLWRPDALEAWFSDMAGRGWELQGIKDGKATFRKAEPQHVFFYCPIFDAIEQEYYIEREEARDEEIKIIEALGWEHVSTCGEVGVFRSKTDSPRLKLHDAERETKKHIRLYKNDSFMVTALLTFAVLTSPTILVKLLYRYTLIDRLLDAIYVLIIFIALALVFIRRRREKQRIRNLYRGNTSRQTRNIDIPRIIFAEKCYSLLAVFFCMLTATLWIILW